MTWQWKGLGYPDFEHVASRSGNDVRSRLRRSGLRRRLPRDDYTLDAGSPGVDAGAFLAAAAPSDLAGEPRLQAGAIDIGAFELPRRRRRRPHPSSAPARYAGDLEWLPADNGWGPAEVDRSNGERAPDDGGPLPIGAATFEKGIGAHAPSRIVVASGRQMLALPRRRRSGRGGGRSGLGRVRGLGRGQRLATSGLVRGPQTSVPVMADLRGVERMALVVKPGGDGNAFDHADWGDARLACTPA